jgi:hypothetical protein
MTNTKKLQVSSAHAQAVARTWYPACRSRHNPGLAGIESVGISKLLHLAKVAETDEVHGAIQVNSLRGVSDWQRRPHSSSSRQWC